jgi:putative peptidoglycan lipid II flippase
LSTETGLRIGPWAIGAGAVLGASLLAGRFSGLLREMQLASTLGVSSQADAAVVLLTLPDLLVNLLLSGGLSAALIPRLKMLPLYHAQVLMRQTLILTSSIFSIFAILFATSPASWFTILAPGLPLDAFPPSSAVLATAIAIPLTAASGVTTAGLNSQQKFLVAGCGTLIFNMTVIAALALDGEDLFGQLVLLGIGVAIGASLRLISQLISLPYGWLVGPITQPPLDRQLIRGFIATAATASLMLLVSVIVRAFASTLNTGAIAAINYATKFVELPAGVLVASVSSVALVRLSELYSKQDLEAAEQTFVDGLRTTLINTIGAGFLIAYFARAIVEIFLGRGAMDSVAVGRVVVLTQVLLLGLPFLAVTSMNMAILNAQEKPQIILKATVVCLMVLPVFALPGMLLGSEILLVWSVVGFQILHAITLSNKIKFKLTSWKVWRGHKLVKSIFINTFIIICVVVVDCGLKLYSMESNYLELILVSLSLIFIIISQKLLDSKKSV